jgi:hypothetical protein
MTTVAKDMPLKLIGMLFAQPLNQPDLCMPRIIGMNESPHEGENKCGRS